MAKHLTRLLEANATIAELTARLGASGESSNLRAEIAELVTPINFGL